MVADRWALGLGKVLDVASMREAAQLLVGVHDFSAFAVLSEGDTRRRVKYMRRLEASC